MSAIVAYLYVYVCTVIKIEWEYPENDGLFKKKKETRSNYRQKGPYKMEDDDWK